MKILIILISMVLTGCYSSSSEVSAYSHSPRTQKSCTEEAKLCPDGKSIQQLRLCSESLESQELSRRSRLTTPGTSFKPVLPTPPRLTNWLTSCQLPLESQASDRSRSTDAHLPRAATRLKRDTGTLATTAEVTCS